MRQKFLHHLHRPVQVGIDLSRDIGKRPRLNHIEVAHDACVIDQGVARREACFYPLQQGSNIVGLTCIALPDVDTRQRGLCFLQLLLIPTCDDHDVTACDELLGKLKADAAGATGNKDCSSFKFHQGSFSYCK